MNLHGMASHLLSVFANLEDTKAERVDRWLWIQGMPSLHSSFYTCTSRRPRKSWPSAVQVMFGSDAVLILWNIQCRYDPPNNSEKRPLRDAEDFFSSRYIIRRLSFWIVHIVHNARTLYIGWFLACFACHANCRCSPQLQLWSSPVGCFEAHSFASGWIF